MEGWLKCAETLLSSFGEQRYADDNQNFTAQGLSNAYYATAIQHILTSDQTQKIAEMLYHEIRTDRLQKR